MTNPPINKNSRSLYMNDPDQDRKDTNLYFFEDKNAPNGSHNSRYGGDDGESHGVRQYSVGNEPSRKVSQSQGRSDWKICQNTKDYYYGITVLNTLAHAQREDT